MTDDAQYDWWRAAEQGYREAIEMALANADAWRSEGNEQAALASEARAEWYAKLIRWDRFCADAFGQEQEDEYGRAA